MFSYFLQLFLPKTLFAVVEQVEEERHAKRKQRWASETCWSVCSTNHNVPSVQTCKGQCVSLHWWFMSHHDAILTVTQRCFRGPHDHDCVSNSSPLTSRSDKNLNFFSKTPTNNEDTKDIFQRHSTSLCLGYKYCPEMLCLAAEVRSSLPEEKHQVDHKQFVHLVEQLRVARSS